MSSDRTGLLLNIIFNKYDSGSAGLDAAEAEKIKMLNIFNFEIADTNNDGLFSFDEISTAIENASNPFNMTFTKKPDMTDVDYLESVALKKEIKQALIDHEKEKRQAEAQASIAVAQQRLKEMKAQRQARHEEALARREAILIQTNLEPPGRQEEITEVTARFEENLAARPEIILQNEEELQTIREQNKQDYEELQAQKQAKLAELKAQLAESIKDIPEPEPVPEPEPQPEPDPLEKPDPLPATIIKAGDDFLMEFNNIRHEMPPVEEQTPESICTSIIEYYESFEATIDTLSEVGVSVQEYSENTGVNDFLVSSNLYMEKYGITKELASELFSNTISDLKQLYTEIYDNIQNEEDIPEELIVQLTEADTRFNELKKFINNTWINYKVGLYL